METLNYLNYLTLISLILIEDPKDLAEEMIEGVNIPGPGLAIPVESSHLPEGSNSTMKSRR